MNTIIAGRFDEQTEVDQTVNDLHRAGFAADQIDTFFVNPPGQHDVFPVGGDQDESAGATNADATAVGGVGVGAIVGIGLVGNKTSDDAESSMRVGKTQSRLVP